jgi:nitric oxide reductase NorQ protein
MILFRAFLEGTSFQIETLPNQKFEKNLAINVSDVKFTTPIQDIVKLPLGTIFCASNYDLIDSDHIVIRKEDVLAIMLNSTIINSDPEEGNNKEIVNYVVDYLFDNPDYNMDDVKHVVDTYNHMGYDIDWDTLTTAPVTASGTTVSNLKRTIAVNYPVPNRDDIGFHIEPEMWYLLVRNVLRGENVMLIGDTGTGKTEIVKHLAKAMNKDLFIQDMGTVQDAQSALLGVHTLNKDGVSEFKHAPFVSHIQSGGIVLLDELSRAPLAANNILFPCLDNRRYLPVDVAHDEKDQKIMVNDATVFIATANIGNEYSGTNALDRALLDRFFPIETQYPQENDEIKVLITRTGIEENEAKAIVKVANEVRKQYRDQELSSSISVRHTLQTAGLVVDGFDLTNALQAVVMPLFDDGIGASERAKVKSIIAAF